MNRGSIEHGNFVVETKVPNSFGFEHILRNGIITNIVPKFCKLTLNSLSRPC